MPRPRHQYHELPAALRFFLAFGTLPPDGSPDRAPGLVEAFKLKYSPTIVAELRVLWSRHADEITAATPAGTTPWAVRVLRAPELVDDATEDDENDTHDNKEEAL